MFGNPQGHGGKIVTIIWKKKKKKSALQEMWERDGEWCFKPVVEDLNHQ